ncbi:hypothetical protein DM860_001170 [Cuscuta australis]|uniref:Uncharacterized protein n=1 Tax=Cuscuta australis TaxID=267555 RepID=A0A328DU80_9ASTE|nr:hypothetical protein DM860_001170 [Cuscuta australis]
MALLATVVESFIVVNDGEKSTATMVDFNSDGTSSRWRWLKLVAETATTSLLDMGICIALVYQGCRQKVETTADEFEDKTLNANQSKELH